MKSQIFPFLALFFVFSSCQNDEDMSPSAKVQGKYEASAELGSSWGLTSYLFVNSLEFKSDGTVYGEGTTLDVESEELLGYRHYFNGTYTVTDGVVTINIQESNYMNIADIDYMEKDDLTLFEDEDRSEEYTIQENFTQLTYMCSTFPNCGSLGSYIKIE